MRPVPNTLFPLRALLWARSHRILQNVRLPELLVLTYTTLHRAVEYIILRRCLSNLEGRLVLLAAVPWTLIPPPSHVLGDEFLRRNDQSGPFSIIEHEVWMFARSLLKVKMGAIAKEYVSKSLGNVDEQSPQLVGTRSCTTCMCVSAHLFVFT